MATLICICRPRHADDKLEQQTIKLFCSAHGSNLLSTAQEHPAHLNHWLSSSLRDRMQLIPAIVSLLRKQTSMPFFRLVL
jgi:hypothetical protein